MAGKTMKVRDVMTSDLVTVPSTATLRDAARQMRDCNIGDVLVADDGTIVGIITDRDIVVRGVAAGRSMDATTVQMICSDEYIATVSPTTAVTDAVDLMKRKAVRRLPVVDGKRAVGIVSLGDLAVDRDPRSALGEISAAPANQ